MSRRRPRREGIDKLFGILDINTTLRLGAILGGYFELSTLLKRVKELFWQFTTHSRFIGATNLT